MTIVTLPRTPVAASIKWTLKQPTQANRGEFTGTRRVTVLAQAPRWSAEVEYPTIVGEHNVLAWRAALARLQGQANSFRLAPCEGPQQARQAVVVVDGAGQSGTTLATRGWVPGTVFRAGYFVTIADRLHQLVAQALPNSSGEAVLELMPHVVGGLADGAAIEVTRPYGLMSLTEDSAGWTVGRGQQYSIALSCEEAH